MSGERIGGRLLHAQLSHFAPRRVRRRARRPRWRAAGVGAATDPSPPFQDYLKVAAVKAGFGVDNMAADEGHGGEAMVEAVPGADGLRSQLAGVTLLPASRRFAAGGTAKWRFMVKDCKGNALRNFEPENGKLLHLIVVRSDFTELPTSAPPDERGGRVVDQPRNPPGRPLPRDR